MKILVTVGSGFIGSHIVEHYQDKADEIRVLDNLRTGYRKNLDVTLERIKQVTAEATQRKEEIDQARKQNQELVAKACRSQKDALLESLPTTKPRALTFRAALCP